MCFWLACNTLIYYICWNRPLCIIYSAVSGNNEFILTFLMQVSIQADLEKKIIKLVNDFRDENGDKGPISGRLTSKKLLVKTKSSLWLCFFFSICFQDQMLISCCLCLQDLYTALQRFSFKREHIEEAMKSSVLYGGDLHSALDWLCLNLKDGNRAPAITKMSSLHSSRGH